ncbi:carbon starvation CstA family protein [Marisediminicola senii]|uniref:carbon starvation CstA family protein n=1 Tax=Marisediminicola senii TaxID=2711233 RepID=UPI0013ECFD02|nr:carbon starvation CstA family protein [Marisediminicola senii]
MTATLDNKSDDLQPEPGQTIELHTDPSLPPVGLRQKPKWTPLSIALWIGIALIGALGWVMIAIVRGDEVNSIWFVAAAVGTFLIGYRFYSRFIERKLLKPDDRRATPAEILDNGKDFEPTDRRVLFGHHFAAIAGAGPLVGPVLAAQMGYLPGTMWIIFGVIVAGAVQDYLVLFFSMRRRGRSLGQMAREELGRFGGVAALIATLLIMAIILAVLALVVVNALAESPWGVFSIAMTIPIALFMGVYLRFLRPGRITEVSLIGVALLLLAIVSGGWVAETAWGVDIFTLDKVTIAWALIIYGFVASILPVWLLLAPRDYLSTFMKIGTILLLAVGIVIAQPVVQMPAVTEFAFNGQGPAFAGALFPFLFITIACGALSGFHSLIASGTTPKLIEKETQTRVIGYGGMLVESFVAIMALVAAITLDRSLYFAMNASAALTGGTAEGAAEFVNGLGAIGGQGVTADQLTAAAAAVGEESLVSRTGGAPTLAVGISNILNQIWQGSDLRAFWYHFAIMFEALFILTTVDAGTRVARFMLSDTLGNVNKRFRDPSWRIGAWISSIIVVAGWGSILIMGVTDPLGGINTLFPLFGIANQLLAAIALAVCVAIVCKKGLVKWVWIPGIPLVIDAIVTLTASYQKIFSPLPTLGYWAQNGTYREALANGETSLGAATSVEAMEAVVRNTTVQGTLSIIFATLVIIVLATAIWVSVRAVRAGGEKDTESDVEPSRMYAPVSLVATTEEKAVQKLWADRSK